MSDPQPLSVLLVDDEAMIREALGQTLEIGGYSAITAASFIEAKDHISHDFTGVVVSDIRMPGKDGFALLEYVVNLDKDLPVILLTGEGDVPMAVRGMALGAYDFLEKPCDPKYLLEIIARAQIQRALVLKNRHLETTLEQARLRGVDFLGTSDISDRLRRIISKAGAVQTPVLISGESGVGRGYVARLIQGLRTPDSLLTELECTDPFDFSAFSTFQGAVVLNNIERLSMLDQAKLLLEVSVHRDGQIYATSAVDIEALVHSGAFNDDLFYRLGVIHIHVPPLSARSEDISVLFDKFLRMEIESGAVISPDLRRVAIQNLAGLEWPGNLKSLRNHAKRVAWGIVEGGPESGLKSQLERVERGIIIEALRHHSGHATQAAKTLGLPRKTFYDRLAKLSIHPEDYRDPSVRIS